MNGTVHGDARGTTALDTEGRETHFQQFVSEQLEPFWQARAETGAFKNPQGLEIHYANIRQAGATRAVVVSPGRIEGYLKYKELAYDLYQAGYSVFIIDHQGQGLSSRRLENAHKGYVSDFQDYVDDLHQFISETVSHRHQGSLFLLAHSMGAAIGLRYIQQFPNTFEKASFSSPMWGFRSGLVPKFIAKGLVDLGHWVHDKFKEEGAYFIGGKDYDAKPFESNELTHSEARYGYFRELYEAQPQLQLGGITFAWLNASITALEQAYRDLDQIEFPIQVFQAQDETVIDNLAQDAFCLRLAHHGRPCYGGKPEVIANARHELFIETDDKRLRLLTSLFRYFES